MCSADNLSYSLTFTDTGLNVMVDDGLAFSSEASGLIFIYSASPSASGITT